MHANVICEYAPAYPSFRYYVRNSGMITYRAEELAQSGRMLTIFAMFYSYSGDQSLLIEHFDKVPVYVSVVRLF